jgi:hypothetical protein
VLLARPSLRFQLDAEPEEAEPVADVRDAGALAGDCRRPSGLGTSAICSRKAPSLAAEVTVSFRARRTSAAWRYRVTSSPLVSTLGAGASVNHNGKRGV